MPFRQLSSSIRVLHVDDDPQQLDMVKQFLGIFDTHLEIDSILNPEEALQKINNSHYDCLITDFKMPEMTGIQLSRKVRELHMIPIILYTGQGTEEVATEAYAVGINDYVRKEIAPEHYQILAKRVRDIVEKERIDHIYSNVVKDAKDAIAITIKNKLIFANVAFLQLVHISEQEMKNNDNFELNAIIEKKISKEEFQRLIKGEINFISTEFELNGKNKKPIPIEIKISVIEYLGEKALLYFLRDITERKSLENEIKKSENKYRSLIQLAPDGIVTLNLTGTVTWINEAYATITGYTAEEVVGKKIWTLKTVRASDARLFLGLFINLMRGKTIQSVEFQWVNKDNQLGWGEGRASLIKIDEKNKEVILSLRDITERKQMEEELRKYSKEMELLATERAEKLAESEKMAYAGAIASTVAHDLKGPLSTILNAVYLMKIKPEKTADMREVIIHAVGNASKMLEETRNKTVTTSLKFQTVDIAPFFEKILRETPIQSHIQIKTKLENVNVEIDTLRIRRVIENLVRNAIEATPTKGTITISARKDGNKLIIQVQDTGVGISEERINKIFKPFQTTKETGTGLGLTYCKNTIEEHGGEIGISSKVGSGTTFTIKIPINRKIISKEIPVPLARVLV